MNLTREDLEQLTGKLRAAAAEETELSEAFGRAASAIDLHLNGPEEAVGSAEDHVRVLWKRVNASKVGLDILTRRPKADPYRGPAPAAEPYPGQESATEETVEDIANTVMKLDAV